MAFCSVNALVQFLPAESISTSSRLKCRGPTPWGSVSSPVTQVIGKTVEHTIQNRASWELLRCTECNCFYYCSWSRATQMHQLCSPHTSSLYLLCSSMSLTSGCWAPSKQQGWNLLPKAKLTGHWDILSASTDLSPHNPHVTLYPCRPKLSSSNCPNTLMIQQVPTLLVFHWFVPLGHNPSPLRTPATSAHKHMTQGDKTPTHITKDT